MTQLESSTSSIDANWPPCVGSNNRIRGFYPSVVDGTVSLDEFATTYHTTSEEVLGDDSICDRVTLRAVATAEAIMQAERDFEIEIEAAMPLFGEDYEDHYLLYAATNRSTRVATEQEMSRHQQVLTDAVSRYDGKYDFWKTINREGLRPRVLNASDIALDKTILERLHNLYGVFGFGLNEVSELVENPNNTIAVLESEDGSVVSTALTETATIPVEGKPALKIAEVTEAVTHPEFVGRGIYTALSRFLVESVTAELTDGDRQLHALYGESNLSSVGVIFAAAKNGRVFNYFEKAHLGLASPNFGILEQNFKVEDGVETRAFNDFALTYHKLG